eukprot:s1714_g2.t1
MGFTVIEFSVQVPPETEAGKAATAAAAGSAAAGGAKSLQEMKLVEKVLQTVVATKTGTLPDRVNVVAQASRDPDNKPAVTYSMDIKLESGSTETLAVFSKCQHLVEGDALLKLVQSAMKDSVTATGISAEALEVTWKSKVTKRIAPSPSLEVSLDIKVPKAADLGHAIVWKCHSPPWHRRQRLKRQKARTRVQAARRRNLAPSRADLWLLHLHHSGPAYRELRHVHSSMGKKPQWHEDWYGRQSYAADSSWQDPSWRRSRTKSQSNGQDRWAFPTYDAMDLENFDGEGHREIVQAQVDKKPTSSSNNLVAFTQKSINQIRKSEGRIRKAEADKKSLEEKWDRYQKMMQETFVQERAKHRENLEKLNGDIKQQMANKEAAVVELYEVLAHPDAAQKEKDLSADKTEVQSEALKVLGGLSGLLAGAFAGASLKQGARQQMLKALQKHAKDNSTPQRLTTMAPRTPTPAPDNTAAMKAPATPILSPLPEHTTTESESAGVTAVPGPYVPSPSATTRPSPYSRRSPARLKYISGSQRMPLTLARRKPAPTPLGGTPLAAKLEKRRRHNVDIQEIHGDSEDDLVGDLGTHPENIQEEE